MAMDQIGNPHTQNLVGVLCLFSSYVGVQDIAAIEILAIAKACELLESRPDLTKRSITIASNCQTAVDWVKNGVSGGDSHVKTIQYICSCLESFVFASMFYCPRGTNQFADNLARKGAAGGEEVLLVVAAMSKFSDSGCLLPLSQSFDDWQCGL
ncbi:hypothetical protein QYF36_008412 [Acer negundo]|nr:hypothetical protein QYF36_008412 [Acer negundo]